MSTHDIPVVRIGEIRPHDNADKLEVTTVFGFTVVIGKGQFKTGDLAIYVPPDYEVPVDRPEFAFLADRAKGNPYYRIRVAKWRGIISQGLLIPAPDMVYKGEHDAVATPVEEGDNLIDHYGIRRYVPPADLRMGGDNVPSPPGYYPKYDVECGRRYNNLLAPGEDVFITEKIDGANARFTCRNGIMYCGSRRHWKKKDEKCAWWQALANHPEVRMFCEVNPDITIYGEIYGNVQKNRYGLNQPRIAVFDLLRGNQWITHDDARSIGLILPWVPFLGKRPFDIQEIELLAEQDSSVKTAPIGHLREGVIVKPTDERSDPKIGRVLLKIVSNRYFDN